MVTRILKAEGGHLTPEQAEEAAAVLRCGGLAAFPTETVYGLGGNALDPQAARRIYAAKGRPSDNPLIVHIADAEAVYEVARDVPETAKRLMAAFWPGPMTLVFPKKEIVPPETTGGLATVAVRLPAHEAARELIRACGFPVAAPSANLSGRPSPTSAARVWEDLAGKIELILDGGPAEIGIESTIIDVTGETPVILRPGFVTAEDVAGVAGNCELDPAVTEEHAQEARPKAPGMKYRHYAPKAEMLLVEGGRDAVQKEIRRLLSEAAAAGRKTGVLCTAESRDGYAADTVETLGSLSAPQELSHNLYECLRRFDERGTEVIFAESVPETGTGFAVRNRLLKAAGYRVRRV